MTTGGINDVFAVFRWHRTGSQPIAIVRPHAAFHQRRRNSTLGSRARPLPHVEPAAWRHWPVAPYRAANSRSSAAARASTLLTLTSEPLLTKRCRIE